MTLNYKNLITAAILVSGLTAVLIAFAQEGSFSASTEFIKYFKEEHGCAGAKCTTAFDELKKNPEKLAGEMAEYVSSMPAEYQDEALKWCGTVNPQIATAAALVLKVIDTGTVSSIETAVTADILPVETLKQVIAAIDDDSAATIGVTDISKELKEDLTLRNRMASEGVTVTINGQSVTVDGNNFADVMPGLGEADRDNIFSVFAERAQEMAIQHGYEGHIPSAADMAERYNKTFSAVVQAVSEAGPGEFNNIDEEALQAIAEKRGLVIHGGDAFEKYNEAFAEHREDSAEMFRQQEYGRIDLPYGQDTVLPDDWVIPEIRMPEFQGDEGPPADEWFHSPEFNVSQFQEWLTSGGTTHPPDGTYQIYGGGTYAPLPAAHGGAYIYPSGGAYTDPGSGTTYTAPTYIAPSGGASSAPPPPPPPPPSGSIHSEPTHSYPMSSGASLYDIYRYRQPSRWHYHY